MKIYYILIAMLLLSTSVSQNKRFTFKKGELIVFIASSRVESESKNIGKEYYSKVFPMAIKHGFKPLIVFSEREKTSADFNPNGFGLYKWPSKKAMMNFNKEPGFKELKSIRPKYFDDLTTISFELRKTLV